MGNDADAKTSGGGGAKDVGSTNSAVPPSPSSAGALIRRIFSLSSVSTFLSVAYVYVAYSNLSNLMNPLRSVDLEGLSDAGTVYPLWDDAAAATPPPLGMRVYLSSEPRFGVDYFIDDPEFSGDGGKEAGAGTGPALLLWAEDDAVGATAGRQSRSFVLLSEEEGAEDGGSPVCRSDGGDGSGGDTCAPLLSTKTSLEYAHRWLDDAARTDREISENGGGIVGTMNAAGGGIESTSVLLSMYTKLSGSASRAVNALLGVVGKGVDGDDDDGSEGPSDVGGWKEEDERRTVRIPAGHPVWTSLMTNGTAHVHVVLVRQSPGGGGNNDLLSSSPDPRAAQQNLMHRNGRHEVLLGGVGMVKHELPNHVPHPRRLLYRDLLYIFESVMKLIGGTSSSPSAEVPPWNAARDQPEVHAAYVRARQDKAAGIKHPYWKPEVRIHVVRETEGYPTGLSDRMGFEVVSVDSRTKREGGEPTAAAATHASGYAHLPALHVDEIGLTSDKYVPLNRTVSALPLRIGFQGGGGGGDSAVKGAATGGEGLTPARYRLLQHLSRSLDSQVEMGFEQSDIDDIRRLVAETNVMLLAVTVIASVLHMLFEFLTFKSDVDFWRGNTDLTGLSVRALFLDFGSQVVVLFYLIEMESSLLMTIPTAVGCLIALWKCQKGAGLALVRVRMGGERKNGGNGNKAWYNRVLGVVGLELLATRLRSKKSRDAGGGGAEEKLGGGPAAETKKKVDLETLTEETDRLATRLLGKFFLIPLVVAYALYSLVWEEHKGWYGWFITTSSSFVYAVGFVLMTPQLFLNYKLRSVAHLPWRVLGYRFVNTFIDDLFAFIIRMPAMARMSCFRDDIVFMVYLYQRWLYPVDVSRPAEGVGGVVAATAEVSSTSASAPVPVPSTKNDVISKGKRKKQQVAAGAGAKK